MVIPPRLLFHCTPTVFHVVKFSSKQAPVRDLARYLPRDRLRHHVLTPLPNSLILKALPSLPSEFLP